MSGMPDTVQKAIEQILGQKINAITQISGGDINEARLLQTAKGFFFTKINSSSFAYEMFETEIQGLETLRKSNTIKIPNILGIGKADQTAFLILEYIEPHATSPKFWKNFGSQLADLHQTTQVSFGLNHNNFIGTLPQSNNAHSSWDEFYINERLMPQLNLAIKKNLLSHSTLQDFELLFKKLNQICPNEPPALIHGDLWNGNFICGKNEIPVLIDPSISFGHCEMDLAMTKLFGGFDQTFYEAYQNCYPLKPNFEDRMEVYQLYYLLVHLNLFGKGYLPSVINVLRKFS